MAITQNTYTGNGSTVLYSFSFPYLETTDVKVSLNGTVTTAYTFANATTIQFNTAPANGAAIRIYRETDDTALQAVLSPGSSIRASDLNDNFDQLIYLGQEANTEADSATATANTALTNSATAISTANTASTNASAAVSTANTASANASAAVSTANTASTNASTAVSTANTASTNASTALSTANAATTTANNAVTTANTASSTASTALTNANAAVSTANTASTNASNAVTTANTASANASSAVTTANNAVTTANSAVITAGSAVTTANSAVTTANAAAAAVANAVLYTTVANVAAIPVSPANNTAIEVTNSTGIESFTPLSGLPAGFVGSSGLSVRIIYQTVGSTWTWIQYFPNDPENRYFKLSGGTITGPITVPQGTVSSPGVKFSGTGNDNTGVYSPGIDELGLVTNGTARLTIDSAGSVSIPGTLGVTGAITGSLTGAASSNVLKAGDTMTGALVHPLGAAATPSITFTGDTNTGIYSPGADQVAISTNGTGRLFVDSTGRVGVNTSSPAAGLDVNNTVFTRGGHKIQGYYATSAGDGNVINIGTSGGVNYIQSLNGATQSQLSIDGNPIVFRGASFNEIARFDTSGRLGLGVSDPGQKLVIGGGTNGRTRIKVDSGSGNFGKFEFSTDSALTTSAVQVAEITANITGTGPLTSSLQFATNSGNSLNTAMTIDSSQRVGIGSNATSPSQQLHVRTDQAAATWARIDNQSSSGSAYAGVQLAGNGNTWGLAIGSSSANSNALTFVLDPNTSISAGEKMRLDTSGRLLVGTSDGSGSVARLIVQGASNSSPVTQFQIAYNGNANSGFAANGTLGEIRFTDQASNSNLFAVIKAETDGVSGTNDYPGRLTFSTTADGASSPTERMRINSSGTVLIGKTAETFATSGTAIYANGEVDLTQSNASPLYVNRTTNDGNLVAFYQDGTIEGSISVSGTTVSYNGAHLSRWSQLPGGTVREEILRGTVLSNIDEMCDWGEEENEQLNRMKVSDVEGDPNVAGVFQAWDDDDDTYTDDFYCAMTGDFIIRIAEGVTVQRGDLLMSAGDGTAKPQDDDVVRSKTVAKVTSTHVTCTYDDGSYCVPCVLMAC